MKVGDAVGGSVEGGGTSHWLLLQPYRYLELIFYLEPQGKVST